MGLDAFQGIQQGFRGDGELRSVLIIIGAITLVVLVFMVYVFIKQQGRRQRAAEQWRGFIKSMAGRGLGAAQSKLLADLAAKESPENPSVVMDELECFERAVSRRLKPLLVFGRRDEAQALGERIHELRSALGFTDRPSNVYCSSRELQSGQKLHIEARRGGASAKWSGRVGLVREDVLEVVDLVPADKPLQDRSVHVDFYDGKRAFGFETDVVESLSDESRCLLAHTIDVRAIDAREFHRVATEQPVTFRADWEPGDAHREGTLQNLSAGGAAFVGGCYYQEGERLILTLDPQALFDQTEDEALASLDPCEVTGTVLETMRMPGGLCLYRLDCRNVEPDVRRFLFQLVQQLELAVEDDSS
jgi:hypothetical protein